jgi:Phosphotransferase enzyme family
MKKHSSMNFWEAPGWIDQAGEWIDIQVEQLGLMRTGALDQPHQRPWSTVFTVPTDAGILYFKAAAPSLAHEAALTQTLAEWFPGCVPAPLASDLDRGWMLLPDHGPPKGQRLRELVRAEGSPNHWFDILANYADLQITLSSRLNELLELRVPDRRLERLPELYGNLLLNEEFLLQDQPDGLDPFMIEQLHRCLPDLAARCQELADGPIPESLNHGDFHDGNVFVHADHSWFFDWGDASITHPFFSLRTVFVSLENSLGWVEGSPKVNPLRDAYLEPWTALAPLSELREVFTLSQRLGPIVSALSWLRVVSSTPADLRGNSIYAVPSLLQEFLGLNP